jgi:hypothetical protein
MLQSSIGYDTQVQILTPDEEAIITRWLGPKSRASVEPLREAMRRLGVVREPTDLFTVLDAAVAKIVLLPVEKRLPQWSVRSETEAFMLHRHQFKRPHSKPDLVETRTRTTTKWAGCSSIAGRSKAATRLSHGEPPRRWTVDIKGLLSARRPFDTSSQPQSYVCMSVRHKPGGFFYLLLPSVELFGCRLNIRDDDLYIHLRQMGGHDVQ